MGAKDKAEYNLPGCNDVFAGIVNVILFSGKRKVRPKSLENGFCRSIYKADGKLQEMESVAVKVLKKENLTLAILGIENQTRGDKYMLHDCAIFRDGEVATPEEPAWRAGCAGGRSAPCERLPDGEPVRARPSDTERGGDVQNWLPPS